MADGMMPKRLGGRAAAAGAIWLGLTLLAASGVQAATPDAASAAVVYAAADTVQVPVPGHSNATGWRAADFARRRAGLTTVYVAPIQLCAAADSPSHDLSPDQRALLDQQFRSALAARLPAGLTLVSSPRADSLRIEVKLADAEMKKAGFNPLNYTPIGFLVSHAKAAAGVSKVTVQGMRVAIRAADPDGAMLWALTIRPLGQPADPGSALDPADADPTRVPMTPVRLDQMPGYLADKAAELPAWVQALPS